jgi:hypothetical protein
MQRSEAVREGILRFYERLSAGDADAFEAGLATEEGVSVIGSGPGEGHTTREDWAATYRSAIAATGMKLRGHDPVGFEEGTVGYGTDTPSFVLPDGSTLRARYEGDRPTALKSPAGAMRLHSTVILPMVRS